MSSLPQNKFYTWSYKINNRFRSEKANSTENTHPDIEYTLIPDNFCKRVSMMSTNAFHRENTLAYKADNDSKNRLSTLLHKPDKSSKFCSNSYLWWNWYNYRHEPKDSIPVYSYHIMKAHDNCYIRPGRHDRYCSHWTNSTQPYTASMQKFHWSDCIPDKANYNLDMIDIDG